MVKAVQAVIMTADHAQHPQQRIVVVAAAAASGNGIVLIGLDAQLMEQEKENAQM